MFGHPLSNSLLRMKKNIDVNPSLRLRWLRLLGWLLLPSIDFWGGGDSAVYLKQT